MKQTPSAATSRQSLASAPDVCSSQRLEAHVTPTTPLLTVLFLVLFASTTSVSHPQEASARITQIVLFQGTLASAASVTARPNQERPATTTTTASSRVLLVLKASASLLTAGHAQPTTSAPLFHRLASPLSVTKSLLSEDHATTPATALSLVLLAPTTSVSHPAAAAVPPTTSAESQAKHASTVDAVKSQPSEEAVISVMELATVPSLAQRAQLTLASRQTKDLARKTVTAEPQDKLASAGSAKIFQARRDHATILETARALLFVPRALAFFVQGRRALPMMSVMVLPIHASATRADPCQAQRDLVTLPMIAPSWVLLAPTTSASPLLMDRVALTTSVALVVLASAASASPSQLLWEAVTLMTMVIVLLQNHLVPQAFAILRLTPRAVRTLNAKVPSLASLETANPSRFQEILATTVVTVSSLDHRALQTLVCLLSTESVQPTMSAALVRLASTFSARTNQQLEDLVMTLTTA